VFRVTEERLVTVPVHPKAGAMRVACRSVATRDPFFNSTVGLRDIANDSKGAQGKNMAG